MPRKSDGAKISQRIAAYLSRDVQSLTLVAQADGIALSLLRKLTDELGAADDQLILAIHPSRFNLGAGSVSWPYSWMPSSRCRRSRQSNEPSGQNM
jgi:hypothetical protein